MRKIDELANEKFNGNVEETLETLIKNKDPQFPELINELNKKEAAFAFRKLHEYHADRIIEESFGGKEKFADDVMIEMKLDEIGMTRDEVAGCSKNPFLKGVAASVVKLVLSVVIPLLIYVMVKPMKNAESILLLQIALISFFTFKTVNCIINFFKFKNVKNKIEKAENKSK